MRLKKIIAVLAAAGIAAGTLAPAVLAADGEQEDLPAITVTDEAYGAVDGEECAASFQKALDQAADTATDDKPVTVIVPAGTYYMSKTLKIDSNTILKCDPAAYIKKQEGAVYSYMLRSAENKKGGYDNVRNITVEGGVWDAMYYRYLVNTGGSHMYFVHGENITFRDVTYKNNYGAHMIEVGGVRNMLVEGCTFDGFEKYTTEDEEGGPEKEAIQLDVAHSTKMLPDAEPYDDTTCVDIIVRNNRFYNCSRGFGTHSAVKGVYIENVLVENNLFENITDQAVYAYRFVNLTVRSNTIKNAAAGVVIKVRHSTGTSGWYDPLPDVETKTVKDYKVLIENNIITTTNDSVLERMQQYGIWVYGIENDKMAGCVIRNNAISSASCGIYANFADDVQIIGNTVKRHSPIVSTSFSADGIKAKTSNRLKIQNNTLLANAGNMFESGIAVRSNSMGGEISGNRVSAGTASGHGIMIASGSAAAISGNTVSGCGDYGIYLNACRTSNSVRSNSISNSGKAGVQINYSSAWEVNSNIIQASRGNGIYLNSSTVSTISGNKITSSGGSGIAVNDSTLTSIGQNNLQKCGTYGIKLDSASVTGVFGNSVSRSARNGLLFNNFSKIKNVYSNNISGNGYSGISFDNWSNAESLYSNTVSGNKKDGVTLQAGSKVTSLYSNRITGSARHGVSAYSAAGVTYLKQNTVSGSKSNGIVFDRASAGQIIGNAVSGCKSNGLYLTGGASAALVSANSLSKNKNGIWIQQDAKIGTVTQNAVSASSAYGVFAGTGSTITAVNKNTITGSRSYGTLLSDVKLNSFDSNKITAGRKYGLYVSGAKADKITSNVLSKNKGGIYFSSAKVKYIKKNNIADNGKTAIVKYKTSKVVKPAELTVNKVKRGAKVITGKVTPKTKVYIKVKGRTYRTKADKKGVYKVKVKKVKKNAAVQATVRIGGNTIASTVKAA